MQTDWISTAEGRDAPPKGPREGLMGWELTLLLFSTLACPEGTEPSPPSWAWSWGQCPQVLNHFQGSQKLHSCLLRAGWLQTPGSQAPSPTSLAQLCQLAPADFWVRRWSGVSVHRCHTIQVALPLYGVEVKKETFPQNPFMSRIG